MSLAGRVMVFAPLVVFGFSTKPPTMIRLFAELAGHYHQFAIQATYRRV
jgi:hypothetical protein